MNTVVLFSGGAASYIAAKRQVEKYGKENVTLLFTDTKSEHPDLYRFLDDACEHLGIELTYRADGRNVWQVFRDERFIGNSRIDPCSRILKREQARKYLSTCDPAETTITIGYDWSEKKRIDNFAKNYPEFSVEAPLAHPPYLTKQDMFDEMRTESVEPCIMYEQGYSHANCSGHCVKAGKGQLAHLYRTDRAVYHYNEFKEYAWNVCRNAEDAIAEVRVATRALPYCKAASYSPEKWPRKDRYITALKERVDGEVRYVSLREFRKRLEAEEVSQGELTDVGGCGCFAGGVA